MPVQPSGLSTTRGGGGSKSLWLQPEWALPHSQLCGLAPGTLAHRHACQATIPHGGGKPPDDKVGKFVEALTRDRRELLKTRVLFCLRVAMPEPGEGDTFEWLFGDVSQLPEDARWFIDGSMYDNIGASFKRLGFAVVVIYPGGDPLAFGRSSAQMGARCSRGRGLCLPGDT